MTGPPITAVTFDFGGVLTRSPFRGLEAYATELGLPVDTFTRYTRGHPKAHQLEVGAITTREYFKYVCLEVQAIYDIRIDIRRLGAAADVGRTADDLNRAMFDLVREVRQWCSTLLLTNNVKEAGWRSLFPFDLFDAVLDSSTLAIRKPDPRIYHELVRVARCRPDQIIFIDDFEENLPPAAALGIRTILFTAPDECRNELVAAGALPSEMVLN